MYLKGWPDWFLISVFKIGEKYALQIWICIASASCTSDHAVTVGGWTNCVFWDSYVEAVTPNVMVFEDGIFRGHLGLEEVVEKES